MKFTSIILAAVVLSGAVLFSETSAAAVAQASGNPPSQGTPNGDPCSTSDQCQSGNCYYSTCTAKMRNGSKCYKPQNCQSGACTSSDRNKPGQCITPNSFGPGSPCKTSIQCASGNCQYSTCVNKKTLGGSCYKAENCQSGQCSSSDRKNPGSCVKEGSIPTGASCTADIQCQEGLFCSQLKGNTCSAQFGTGHNCSRDAACQSNFCSGRKCS